MSRVKINHTLHPLLLGPEQSWPVDLTQPARSRSSKSHAGLLPDFLHGLLGWTVQLRYPWDLLAWTPVWIIAAAALAGLLPATRAARIQPATALRSE